MAHFAKIEDGKVVTVLVVANEHESYGEEYLHSLGLDGKWVQTSYHGNFRKKFAAIGDSYDEENDWFMPAELPGNIGFDEEKWTWIVIEPEVTDGND
jgi:hypothetical protein